MSDETNPTHPDKDIANAEGAIADAWAAYSEPAKMLANATTAVAQALIYIAKSIYKNDDGYDNLIKERDRWKDTAESAQALASMAELDCRQRDATIVELASLLDKYRGMREGWEGLPPGTFKREIENVEDAKAEEQALTGFDITGRFLSLPYSIRHRIMSNLGVTDPKEHDLPDRTVTMNCMRRVRIQGLAPEFVLAVEAACDEMKNR